jgi:eukaryotic-like serine/threonine-protein kinase
VTEWVDGETLDAHARRLDLWSRVERMVAVCGAVAAAHGSLIVHRDLKPGNILVDRAGVVKLLDFGISVAEDEGERLTMTGMNRMTAAYASPEQLRAEREVRTASDVYSLGVILHELASGESPYGDLRQISSYELPGFILGLEEWNGGARSGIADRDLRAIVQQAMRRAPEERYETAAAMRDDLERWLRGEAVAARGRSRAYLAKKFVRRHWAAIVTMAAAFAVVSGLGIAAWRNARAAEERNARIFALVMEELTDATVSQRTLRGRQGLGVSANLMDVRVRSVRRMVAESPGDRKLRRGLLFLLAERAPMLGYPSAISLGRTAEAEAAYREMVAVGERLLREEDDVDVRSQVINGLVGLGTVLLEMGRNEEAGREFGRARELVESSERSQLRRLQGLEARGHLARILNLQGKREESLRLREEVVAGREREYKTRGEELAWGYAGAVVSRAYLLREMGRAREALGEYERVLPLIERNARREERDLTSQWNLARQYEETGRCAEAVGDTPAAAEWYEKAVAIYRRIGMLEPDAWSNWRALAVCLWRQAGLGTGSPYLRKVEALDLARRAAAHDPASVKAKREVAEMERKGI